MIGYYALEEIGIPANLLLDNYTGAAAGYSLRQIRGGANKTIRVRRSSDNSELDIGFSNGQINQTTLLEFVGAGNGYIRTLYDQSGTGNHLNQTNPVAQPLIVSAGTLVTENGDPAISFTGTQWLDSTPGGWGFSDLSIFYVATSTGSGQRIFDTRGTGGAGTIKGWQVKWNNSIISDISLFDNGLGNSIYTTGFQRSGHKLVSIHFTGTNLNEYTNSLLSSSVNSANPIDITNNIIGRMGAAANNNSQAFVGKIQEFVLFSSEKSADRAAIETDMNSYYSIF